MPERIQPPKLKGYEDDNVFDLTAYRAALQSKNLTQDHRNRLLETFDEIADEMRDLEHAEDGLEFAIQVHGIATRLEGMARTAGTVFPENHMRNFADALTLARAAAASARHTQETSGSLQDAVSQIERAKRELLAAIRVLFTELVRSGPQAEK